jgi:hypothetical protein
MSRHFQIITSVVLAGLFLGCATSYDARNAEVVLYDSNQEVLATLFLALPRTISTNWSDGQWRGELSPTYVRPAHTIHYRIAADMVKAQSWRPLRCRLDLKYAPAIHVVLDPESSQDFLELFMPADAKPSSPPVWNHITDAGGAETGAIKVLCQ